MNPRLEYFETGFEWLVTQPRVQHVRFDRRKRPEKRPSSNTLFDEHHRSTERPTWQWLWQNLKLKGNAEDKLRLNAQNLLLSSFAGRNLDVGTC
jgi:hypothetical protein